MAQEKKKDTINIFDLFQGQMRSEVQLQNNQIIIQEFGPRRHNLTPADAGNKFLKINMMSSAEKKHLAHEKAALEQAQTRIVEEQENIQRDYEEMFADREV